MLLYNLCGLLFCSRGQELGNTRCRPCPLQTRVCMPGQWQSRSISQVLPRRTLVGRSMERSQVGSRLSHAQPQTPWPGLGPRLNKKEKANQIPMLIFLFFLTVDAVWSTMSQASATMQSCCLDVPIMLTILWGREPRQNLPSFSCFCHDNKTSY